MANLIERWWNGSFGTMTRKEVRLSMESPKWTVEIQRGSIERDKMTSWTFDDEAQARAFLARCIETGGEGWQRM